MSEDSEHISDKSKQLAVVVVTFLDVNKIKKEEALKTIGLAVVFIMKSFSREFGLSPTAMVSHFSKYLDHIQHAVKSKASGEEQNDGE